MVKKKNIIAAFLMICLLFTLCGCGSEGSGQSGQNSGSDELLTEDYSYFAEGDYLCALGFIGFYYESDLQNVVNNYNEASGITDSDWVDCSGEQGYLIIPKYQGSVITVEKLSQDQQLTEDNKSSLSGDNLITTEKSLFVFCNPSNTWSNVKITVAYGNESIVFSPQINPDNNRLVVPDRAKDITSKMLPVG